MTTNADLQKIGEDVRRLAEKVDALQKQMEKIEPHMWIVTAARWVVGAFGVIIVVAIVTFAASWGSLTSQVKQHDDSITKLQNALDDSRKETTRLAEDGRKDNARLVELMLDRFPKKVYGALVCKGRLVAVVGKSIVVLDDDTKQELTAEAAGDVEITIKGQKAKLSDLRPGMRVEVVINDSLAIKITAGN